MKKMMGRKMMRNSDSTAFPGWSLLMVISEVLATFTNRTMQRSTRLYIVA